ncbi:MAG TPA: hypothetical protein VH599_07240 [Ktedonobacterales bacterium]|jgi:hypothetical protein
MAKHGWEIYGVPEEVRYLFTKYTELKDRNLGEAVGEALRQYVAGKLSPAMIEEILADQPQELTAAPAE